jgi:hypothetical protein
MSKRSLLPACALLALGLSMAAVAATAYAAPLPASTSSPGSWPSLEAQLARDHVPAGSALEKLIASNQDFQLLRPEEAADKIAVPLWLRVLWRKRHPEGNYTAADGTGGYPLVLHETHEWMVHHPDLQAVIESAGPAEKAKKPSAPGVGVGGDLNISGTQPFPRSESDIRINYWDPSRIVAASNNIIGGSGLAIYYSHDGGATWGRTALPVTFGQDKFHSDPAVDWTSDGTVWATTIGVTGDSTDLTLHLRSFKSVDNGATWAADATVSGDSQDAADKNMMWVDHSGTSPHKDNIYVIWHNFGAVYVSHHSPGGGWSDPLQISRGETVGTGIGGDIKTDAAGNVYAYWPDTGSRKIYFSRSADGGQSFSKPVAIGSTYQSFQTFIPAQNERGVLTYVSSGTYVSGKSTLLFAVWTDLYGGTNCRTPSDDPQGNVNSTCKTRIWFTRSTNTGKTWTKPRMLNNQTSRNDQFAPWLAVDPTSGATGVIYYDTVGQTRTAVNVFYLGSTNGGATFLAPVRISTAPSDQADPDDGNQFGDYNSLSAFGGSFFPSWTDRRGNVEEEIWTAPLTFPKTAVACRTVNLFAESVGNGVASVVVPQGATETQLSLWHRRNFVSGLNGGSLQVAVDGGPAAPLPAAAILSGAPLGSSSGAASKALDLSPVNTLINLDAACRAATGGDCGGHSLRLSFSAGADASATGDAWFLDDAAVTSCAP